MVHGRGDMVPSLLHQVDDMARLIANSPRLPAAIGILLLGIATNQLRLNQIIPRQVLIKCSDGAEHDGCRLTPGAQHYIHLGDRAQGLYPAATMLFTSHGEELTYERLDRGRVGGVSDARCPAHEAPGSAIRPVERATGRQYSGCVLWLGRDGGRIAFSEEPKH